MEAILTAMAKFLQSFSFLFVLSLLLSGVQVNRVNGQCQKVMDVYCQNAKFDALCDKRCLEEDQLGLSSCVSAPGFGAGSFLCICTYPCA